MKSVNWRDKILDVIIVVFSILVALGLESWYESRKESQLEQQYITTILKDITVDIKDLQEDRDFTNDQHKSIISVLEIINEQDTANLDSILKATIHFGNFKEFIPNSTVFKSLSQSGTISIIKNYDLKVNLGQLHLVSYQMVDNAEEVYEKFYLNLLEFLKSHFNYMNGVVHNGEDFYALEFTNLIVALQSATQQKIYHYDSAIEKAKTVKVQLIEIKE